MADIVHRVQMQASLADVYRALTQEAGLSGWWTRHAKAEPRVDSLAEFRLGDGHLVKMRIAELKDDARVAWHCVEGPPDWVGTEVTFDLAREGEATVVRFGHRNWREATDFMGHCNTTWASSLFTLKALLETPEPDDLLF